VIVSVSPQSRASLAARHGLTPGQAQRKLAALFRGLGAAHVLDLGLARDMALLEAAAEFVARYRARAEAAQRLAAGAHHHWRKFKFASVCACCASRAVRLVCLLDAHSKHAQGHGFKVGNICRFRRATVDAYPNNPMSWLLADDGARTTDAGNGQSTGVEAAAAGPVLPMLASACPGWVCYAEKTQGAWVLPHISSAKSPQAVQGYGARHASSNCASRHASRV